MRIAVTGATGHFGSIVIEQLLERGISASEIVAVVRSAEKAQPLVDRGIDVRVAEYEDQSALAEAFSGVDRLVFVSGSEVGQRSAQHKNVIEAAKVAGISLIAYTSILNIETSTLGLSPEHRDTEQMLAESGIDYVLLRNGWYWENYASSLDAARATGKFFGAVGQGRVSGAARRDYAEAAAVVIASENQAGKVYELAGAPALTYPELASAMAEVLKTPVEYVNLSVEDYQQALESAGMSAEYAGLFAGMEPAIGQGALLSESTDLQQLIGRESTPAVQVLA